MINFSKKYGQVKIGFRPSLLKLISVYLIAFFAILIFMNFSVATDSWAFMMNKFTDRDEILETELLMAKYKDWNPFPVASPVQTAQRGSVVRVLPEYSLSNQQIDKNSIYIPKINVKAPIIAGTSIELNKLLKELEKGVLMYPGSAMPGQGNTVIVGHSSSNKPWNKYGNIFSLLNKLEAGDLIYINYNDKLYVYKVDGKKTGSVFSLSKTDLSGDLVLSSCWPVGTDNGRIAIVANLVP